MSIFSLPATLDLHRRQSGLKIKELCSLVGISRQSYYYYVKGIYHPNEEIFRKIKEVLEINPTYNKFKRASDQRGWKKGKPRKKKKQAIDVI